MKFIYIFVIAVLLLASKLPAEDCSTQLFSLSAYKNGSASLRIDQVLKELSLKCDLSIVFEDKQSKKAIQKELDYVNIKDYTFNDFIDFLFERANLFYDYDQTKNTLRVKYLDTRTFSIDYINVSELESESTKSINSGTSSGITSSAYGTGGYGTTGGYGGGYGATGGIDNGIGGSMSAPSTDYTIMKTKSKFEFWENIKKNIIKLFENPQEVKLFLNKDASLLTVTASKHDMQTVEKFLDTLMEKMHKQVLIEAKIIEVVYDNSTTTGVDWSKLDLNLAGTLTSSDGQGLVDLPKWRLSYSFTTAKFLQFLNRYGTVKVLSNPKIVTLNNQPAVINVGKQLSYKYQTGSVTTTGGTAAGTNTFSLGSTFVGITLYVIPEVSSNNDIIMKINPVISRLANEDDVQQGNRELPPDVKIKQMSSIVKVKDGEKVLIGGLISILKTKGTTKVPLLGDIPFLEGLFGKKQDLNTKSEMFILIVPKIVKYNNMPTIDEAQYKFTDAIHSGDTNQGQH